MMNNYSVTLETLKSKLHNEKAIEKGIELWKRDKVAFEPTDEGGFRAQVADKDETRGVLLAYSSDGCDLEHYYCHCRPAREGAICKHIVAATLAVQGGIINTNITLGMNTSHVVGQLSRADWTVPSLELDSCIAQIGHPQK